MSGNSWLEFKKKIYAHKIKNALGNNSKSATMNTRAQNSGYYVRMHEWCKQFQSRHLHPVNEWKYHGYNTQNYPGM
jgi:hypothetical protein